MRILLPQLHEAAIGWVGQVWTRPRRVLGGRARARSWFKRISRTIAGTTAVALQQDRRHQDDSESGAEEDVLLRHGAPLRQQLPQIMSMTIVECGPNGTLE